MPNDQRRTAPDIRPETGQTPNIGAVRGRTGDSRTWGGKTVTVAHLRVLSDDLTINQAFTGDYIIKVITQGVVVENLHLRIAVWILNEHYRAVFGGNYIIIWGAATGKDEVVVADNLTEPFDLYQSQADWLDNMRAQGVIP